MFECEWHGLRLRLLHLLSRLLCNLWSNRELSRSSRLLHLLLRLVSTHSLWLGLELGRLPSHDLLGRLLGLLLRLLHLLLVLLDVHSLVETGLHWVWLWCACKLTRRNILWLLLLWLRLGLLSWCLLNRLLGLLWWVLGLLLDNGLHSCLRLRLLLDLLLLNHL